MKDTRSIVLVGILLTMIALSACFKGPALRLENSAGSVVVHIETLGEYMTTVRRVRIDEASTGRVIFDLMTESGTPQIFNFRLSAGENSTHIADPEHGSYRVAEPIGKNTFSLQKGIRYRLMIWGDGRSPSEADIEF